MQFRPSPRRLMFTLLIGAMFASGAVAASWDSIKTATITGVGLDRPLQAGMLDYTLIVGSNPTITIGSNTYAVNWVQAVYVVSGTPDGSFVATEGPGPKGWSWDSKSTPAQISGWSGHGNDRIKPGQSAPLKFGSFDPGSNPVVPAYHISYQDGKDSVTDWFKPNSKLSAVPEPTSIVCLSVGIAGLLFVAKQRKRTRWL